MIRAVLDTNVLVAALLSPLGNPAQLIEVIYKRQLALAYSTAILDEYREVLARPKFGFDPYAIEALLLLIKNSGICAQPDPSLSASITHSPDPEDDAIILCAAASQPEFIVTGSLKHFPLLVYNGARVLLPREMLEHLRTRQFP